jgi:hypothetical protein
MLPTFTAHPGADAQAPVLSADADGLRFLIHELPDATDYDGVPDPAWRWQCATDLLDDAGLPFDDPSDGQMLMGRTDVIGRTLGDLFAALEQWLDDDLGRGARLRWRAMLLHQD